VNVNDIRDIDVSGQSHRNSSCHRVSHAILKEKRIMPVSRPFTIPNPEALYIFLNLMSRDWIFWPSYIPKHLLSSPWTNLQQNTTQRKIVSTTPHGLTLPGILSTSELVKQSTSTIFSTHTCPIKSLNGTVAKTAGGHSSSTT
jgi:hypothetical protein